MSGRISTWWEEFQLRLFHCQRDPSSCNVFVTSVYTCVCVCALVGYTAQESTCMFLSYDHHCCCAVMIVIRLYQLNVYDVNVWCSVCGMWCGVCVCGVYMCVISLVLPCSVKSNYGRWAFNAFRRCDHKFLQKTWQNTKSKKKHINRQRFVCVCLYVVTVDATITKTATITTH